MSEYLIKGDTLITLANHARRISETTEELNAAEMAEIFSRTQGECLDEVIETNDENSNSSLYLIQDDTMNIMANHARRISGTTEGLNAEEITDIFSRTQGSIKTDGEYLVEAINAGGEIIKSGTYDTGEVFAFPDTSSADDLYVLTTNQSFVRIANFDKWVATSHTNDSFAVVEDAPIKIAPLYKPVNNDFIMHVNIPNDNTTITLKINLSNGFVINWGDGISTTINVAGAGYVNTHVHTYTSAGSYLITIPYADRSIVPTIGIAGDDTTANLIELICVPKWFANRTGGIWNTFRRITGLKAILLEDGVKSKQCSFDYTTSLKYIILPDSIELHENEFEKSGIKWVRFPHGITSIPRYCFYYCQNLNNVIIPDSVTSIGDSAFNNCTSLNSIFIPDSVTSIGDYAFNSCTSLNSIFIPDSVTSIGEDAFSNCVNLIKISGLNNVTSIGNTLLSVAAGGNISIINIKELVFPSVTSIGYGAFNDACIETLVLGANSVCEVATDQYYPYLFLHYANGTFPYLKNIYVPDELVNSYKTDAYWSVHASCIKPMSEYNPSN